MSLKSTIMSVDPVLGIPGGEISVYCEASVDAIEKIECLFDEIPGQIIAASSQKLLVRIPEGLSSSEVSVRLSVEGESSNSVLFGVGRMLCDGMHMVSNPAIDPKQGSIIMTRSGTRGQELPDTLFRFDSGIVETIKASVVNPTGLAFDSYGKLVATNRADGEVVQINDEEEAVTIASDLGVATGIAFDRNGLMYVGDRSGKIYLISAMGDKEIFADIEPSVSAFHMAFGKEGRLFVSAPGLCSHDVIHFVDPDGKTGLFYKGLGRPQGLAVDEDGDVYVAACLRGRHGIVRIRKDGSDAELWVSGMGIVGLCFDKNGRLIVATAESIYRLDTTTHGLLPG
jgi:sugar lactone lactonase YvrE